MSTPNDGGVQAVYDFWLGLIPQFFNQLGAPMPAGGASAAPTLPGLSFPADQVARAAAMTQQALSSLTQVYTPLLQGAGAPGLFEQWAAAMPFFPGKAAAPVAGQDAANAFAPWNAVMALMPGLQAQSAAATKAASSAFDMPGAWIAMMPFNAAAQALAGGAGRNLTATGMPSFEAMQQAWRDFGTQMMGATPQSLTTSFDRTFGALTDALGFGPMRKLQTAWQDLVAASFAQNEARASYLMLVQGAFAAGLDGLLQRLADMADRGERVDSVLGLLRLWAVNTEEAVHKVLQSDAGLATTANVARAGLANRRKIQHLAGIIADGLDLATRRDLDEAYREIQELKREVRRMRAAARPAGKAGRAGAGGTKETVS